MKMLHTCIRVQHLGKSIAFYKEAFDFQEKKKLDYPEHKFSIVYLGLEGDDYELELTYNYDHEPYNIGDGYGHIAIGVDEFEALHDKQVAAGFNVTDYKGLPDSSVRYYFITDPDGYKVEVIQNR